MPKLKLFRGRGTIGSDTVPDAFSFTDVTGQIESTPITSAGVTISGINAATSFTVTGGTIDKNGNGTFTSSGTVVNGDVIRAQGTSNATYLGTTNVVVNIGGVADTFTITTRSDPGISLVQPHANWNGTAGSGAGAPAGLGESRTGARAVGYFLNPSFQRISGSSFNVKVVADCFDGVSSVQFSGDIVTTTVSTPALRANTDVNGVTKYEYVYDIDLDIPAILVKHGSVNTMNIYATITATNGSVQRKVIGPLVLYPEATQYTWSATVTPNGLNENGTAAATPTYTTLRAALDAAYAAGVGQGTHEGGLITVVKTATYDLVNAGGYAEPGRGYLVITHAPGVVATLARSSQSSTNYGDNHWIPGYNGIEWRGSGIVFDQKNWIASIYANSSTKPPWFNGCKFTTSDGSALPDAFNKGAHPGIGAQGNSSTGLASYYTDITIEWLSSPCQSQLMATGIKTNGITGDLYSNTPLVYGTYDLNPTAQQMRTSRAAMTIAWNGTPGAGTIQYTQGSTTGTFVLVDPNGTRTLYLSNVDLGGTDDVWTFTQLKTKIEAHHPSWACTVSSDAIRAQCIYGDNIPGSSENGFGPYAVTSTPLMLNTFQSIHGDWWQGSHGGADCESIFLSRSILRGSSTNLSSSLNIDSRNQWDTIMTHLVFEDNNSVPLLFTVDQHMVLRHNYGKQGMGFQNTQDGFCEITDCIYNDITCFGGSWPTAPRIKNNATVGGTATANNGTGNTSGNFTVSSLPSLFVNQSTGDYRPAGQLLTNKKTPTEAYDMRGLARSNPDAVGPNSDQGSAASYPF